MNRRELLRGGALGVAALASSSSAGAARVPRFAHAGLSLAALQDALATGALTSEQLCAQYLARIASVNDTGPRLRAVLETNRDALTIAKALDRERKAKGARGPLHGLPVLLKDNLDTGDYQQTTAGSLALVGAMTLRDAFVVKRLREAGAVVLGKANLSEWANIRSLRSVSGWSARGGQCRNPYALDRTPSGSSSGSAVGVAADLCAFAVGTETDGSIVSPASACGVVGLKPTVGLLSRAGIIPISSSQDTPGPLTRSVADAAVVLRAMLGVDADDPATASSAGRLVLDPAKDLVTTGLEKARLGVVRSLAGKIPRALELFERALSDLKRLGAELVDEVELPLPPAVGEAELEVMLYELKATLDRYLAARIGTGTGPRSLEDLVAFNQRHAEAELSFFGQDLFERAVKKGPLTSPEYLRARALCVEHARTRGIELALKTHRLDALVAPTCDPACLMDPVCGEPALSGASSPAAIAGFPSLSVPMGDVFGLPVGLLFFGGAWSEATLLKLAHAYEVGTKRRTQPTFAATLTPEVPGVTRP